MTVAVTRLAAYLDITSSVTGFNFQRVGQVMPCYTHTRAAIPVLKSYLFTVFAVFLGTVKAGGGGKMWVTQLLVMSGEEAHLPTRAVQI